MSKGLEDVEVRKVDAPCAWRTWRPVAHACVPFDVGAAVELCRKLGDDHGIVAVEDRRYAWRLLGDPWNGEGLEEVK